MKSIIRPARPEDMPAIRALHGYTEKRVGLKMDLPEVGDRAMLGYWVVVRGGVVVKAFYEEMCIEHVEIGTDPQSANDVWKFQNVVFSASSAKGARFLHCFVPPALDGWLSRLIFRVLVWLQSKTARLIGKYLKAAGFKATGFIHYSRRLR